MTSCTSIESNSTSDYGRRSNRRDRSTYYRSETTAEQSFIIREDYQRNRETSEAFGEYSGRNHRLSESMNDRSRSGTRHNHLVNYQPPGILADRHRVGIECPLPTHRYDRMVGEQVHEDQRLTNVLLNSAPIGDNPSLKIDDKNQVS